MLAILGVVAPVFLVIAAGWLAVRAGLFTAPAVDGLLAFSVRFGVPLVLFGGIYRLDFGAVFDPRLMVSFYTGAFTCFVAGILLARHVWGRRPGEAVAIGFCALFSNSLLLGLPIMTRAYGPDALAPNYAILSIHAPLCYLIGIVTMEVSRRDGSGIADTARRAARAMFSNALTIGLACGFVLNVTGVRLPGVVLAATDMLAGAALPTALFGIGGALTRYSVRADAGVATATAALSVLVHPAIAYGLSKLVFDLPDEWVRAAVVTAAMPTGMNGYMFASMYRRAEGAAASTVLIGTAASVVTVTFWLWVLGGASLD